MAEKLSQTEIDALLGSSADPLAAADPGYTTSEDVQLYDFRRPRHVSKERLRTLEAMYERLTKSLEAWLIGRVRRQVELKLQSVEQFTFGEFTFSLPTPCASYGFDIVNVPGQKGVIDIGHEFAYFLVDRFFGGSDNPALMRRAMTPIERLAVRMVVERMSGLLAEIWQDFVGLDLAITTFESFPEMVQGVAREDPVLVANIQVSSGSLTSLLVVCLPLSVLDKFFSSSDSKRVKEMTGSDEERRRTRELAEDSLRATNVDITARMPMFNVTMRQLLNLPMGSVIPTGIPTDTPLELHIGGHKRYSAAAGRIGKKLAVRLLDAPEAPGTR